MLFRHAVKQLMMLRSSSGLGCYPLKVVTGVRVPYGAPHQVRAATPNDTDCDGYGLLLAMSGQTLRHDRQSTDCPETVVAGLGANTTPEVSR